MGGCHIDARGNLLHQGQYVAHAQHALRVAVGIEQLQTVHFFAGTRELDRHTGDLTHRQGRTTARIAVEFGQHNAGQWQCVFKCFGGVDRVLALHRVDYEQGFDGVQNLMQDLNFLHQGFVNA